jgi:hypothetical protein
VERFQLSTAFGKDIRTVSVNWGIFDSIEIGGAVVDRNNQNNKVIATAKGDHYPAELRVAGAGIRRD